jgi:hypothetical protein
MPRSGSGRDRRGGADKKVVAPYQVVAPSQRREMAQWAVAQRSAMIGLAYQAFWHQPDLLPLEGQAGRGIRRHRPQAGTADEQPAQLGLRFMLPLPAQRERLQMEPQKGLQDLPRVEAEPADQAAPSAGARETAAIGCADCGRLELVDGLHA